MMFWLKYSFKSALGRRKRTLIIYIGLSLAVAVLVLLGSLMTGVNDRMVDNSISLFWGHVSAEGGPFPLEKAVDEAKEVSLLEEDGLEAVLPRFQLPLLLKKGRNTAPVMMNGVYPEREKGVAGYTDLISSGKWLEGEKGIVVGRKTADLLSLVPGDKVSVIGSGSSSP